MFVSPEPLTQTKPQVANLKPPAKLGVSNKSAADSENETSPLKSPLASNTLPKVLPNKKPASLTPQLPVKPPVAVTQTATSASSTKPLT